MMNDSMNPREVIQTSAPAKSDGFGYFKELQVFNKCFFLIINYNQANTLNLVTP
jgi:hypothetical protein